MRYVLVLMLLCAVAPVFGQRVTLVRNGRPEFSILITPDATPGARFAATELQQNITAMSGATLPIVIHERTFATPERKLIVIDHDRRAAGTSDDPLLGEEEFHLFTDGNQLLIEGGGKRGALYGVYSLLEGTLGCRWYTARVSRIPKRKTITVGPLNVRQKPAFEYREPYYTEAFDRLWAVRNRTNGNAQRLDEAVGGKVSYGPFVHTFNSLVPPEEYYDTHPEYFSMINGKRMKGYYQLCLTNPDVLRISIEKVRQWIRENPTATIFSVSQNDTGYNCQCDQCKAVEREEGAPSGVVLRFVNAIADAIAKDHPNVLIDTLAYQWTEDPPKRVRPRPNVRIRLAPIGACVSHALDQCDANKHAFENLTAWSKITEQLYIWHYSTNFANYLQPLPDLDEIAADIPLFKKHGVVGLFYEGDYAPGGGGEMSELKAYLMSKLMWDPSRPVKPIITDFLNGVYGKGAPYIQRWLDVLHQPERTASVHAHIYDPPTAPYLSQAALDEGAKLFDAAEKATANDPTAHDEVERARLALEYVQLARSMPEYAVEGGNYQAASTGSHALLAEGVAAKIKRYGIGQVREGEPVESYLGRIAARPPSYPVVTLENSACRVDIVPELGGRIVRLMDKAAGRNMLHEPSPSDADFPNAGGYEEYAGDGYRAPGWNVAYAPERMGENGLRLIAGVSNGLSITRTYRLDGSDLRIETTLTNTGSAPRSAVLRTHPEFAWARGAKASVRYTDARGKAVTRPIASIEGDTYLKEDARPAGEATLDLGDARVSIVYPKDEVNSVLLSSSGAARRANCELITESRSLARGASLTLRQTWHLASRGSR